MICVTVFLTQKRILNYQGILFLCSLQASIPCTTTDVCLASELNQHPTGHLVADPESINWPVMVVGRSAAENVIIFNLSSTRALA